MMAFPNAGILSRFSRADAKKLFMHSSATSHLKATEQYFTVVLFSFQFYPVCNF